MAAMLESIRQKGRDRIRKSISMDDIPVMDVLELKLPSRNERVLNLVCDKLNETIGMWQPRTFVVSTAVLYFGKPDSDQAIGTVPLYEITKIRTAEDKQAKEKEDKVTQADLTRKESFFRRGQNAALPSQVFEVCTELEGYNSGKKFKFRASSPTECQDIVATLQRMVRQAIDTHKRQTNWQKSQQEVARIFNSSPFQMSSALLIFANFLFNVIQNQTLPQEGTAEGKLFEDIDLAFTIIFTVELLMNAYGHWWRPFFTNGWSMFDLAVVFVSLLAVGVSAIPGISILRLMRVFRVIRLFGRLKALRKIINALAKSIIPVANSFVILFLITCIYALIGVSFFGEREPEIFGTFAQAIMVMFQLTAGESWLPGMPAFDERGVLDGPVVAFTCSYIIIVNWTLLQVSVAVLLDNFVAGTAEEEAAEEVRMREEKPVRIARPSLDPMLQVLTDHFDNEEDLAFRINHIYDMMDEDEAGSMSREQLLRGFKTLPLHPPVHVLSEDLDQILASAGVFNEIVTKADFRKVVMRQVLDFVLRRVTDCAKNNINQELTIAQMAAFKLSLSMIDRLERRVAKSELCVDLLADLARRQDARMGAMLKHLKMADPASAMGGDGTGNSWQGSNGNEGLPRSPAKQSSATAQERNPRQKWREGIPDGGQPSLPVEAQGFGWGGADSEEAQQEGSGDLFTRITSELGGVFAGTPSNSHKSLASSGATAAARNKIDVDVGFVSPAHASSMKKKTSAPAAGPGHRGRAAAPSLSPYNARDLNVSEHPPQVLWEQLRRDRDGTGSTIFSVSPRTVARTLHCGSIASGSAPLPQPSRSEPPREMQPATPGWGPDLVVNHSGYDDLDLHRDYRVASPAHNTVQF